MWQKRDDDHDLFHMVEEAAPEEMEPSRRWEARWNKWKGQLVVPVDEDHMYYAAINSKSCRLTALGAQYWQLATENKL